MIKALLFIALALIVPALAPLAIGEKGYVLIGFNNYTIEGTITAFVFTAFVLFGAGYIVNKLVRYFLSLYSNTRFKWSLKAEERKLDSIQSGIWQFINADYSGVQQTLEKAPVPKGWENIAAAITARAALNNNDKTNASQQLAKVSDSDTGNIAQMLVATEQASIAKNAMDKVAKNKQPNAHDLANLSEYLIAQQDWQQLASHITLFDKKQALSRGQWQQLFARYFAALDKAKLEKAFSSLPKKLKEQAEKHYLFNVIAFAPEQADKQLVKLAKSRKYTDIYSVLADIELVKLPELYKYVQGQLKKSPEDESLLLTLAYIAKAQGDYALACKAFNKVMTQQNAEQHWRIAATCFAKQHDNDKALSLYQQYA
jgi:HemY protein